MSALCRSTGTLPSTIGLWKISLTELWHCDMLRQRFTKCFQLFKTKKTLQNTKITPDIRNGTIRAATSWHQCLRHSVTHLHINRIEVSSCWKSQYQIWIWELNVWMVEWFEWLEWFEWFEWFECQIRRLLLTSGAVAGQILWGKDR